MIFSYFWMNIKRELARISLEFKRFWKSYIFQTLLSSVVVFLVLLLLNMEDAVIIASIGATVFIVFAMPQYITAQPRRIIGGYIIGLVTGALFALIPHPTTLSAFTVYSAAVGSSIFLMIVFDAEHPPASGIALGTAITGVSPRIAIAVVTSCLVLSAIHVLTRRYLRDLI